MRSVYVFSLFLTARSRWTVRFLLTDNLKNKFMVLKKINSSLKSSYSAFQYSTMERFDSVSLTFLSREVAFRGVRSAKKQLANKSLFPPTRYDGKLQNIDHDGTRTHNLPIRSRTPYPLGHAAGHSTSENYRIYIIQSIPMSVFMCGLTKLDIYYKRN